MNQPLRIGILGSGFMAGVHADALKKIPGVTLAAVANPNPTHAAEFATARGIPASYGNFTTMLDSEKLDAVYLCIPPFAHQGEAELASSRGLHLFLEKPIALDSARATHIVAAIEKAGVKSQVGFHMRFRKSVRTVKALLDSGAAGQPTLFSGRYWVSMDGSPWWRNLSKSGGQIFEQVTHLYDLAAYLCGDIKSAQGLLRNLCHQNRPDYTIEDTSIGTLQFKSGALGVITGSNCAIPMHFIGDFKLVCEKLALDYQCTGQHWITPDSARLFRGAENVESFIEDEDPYLLESLDFITAIRENRPTTTPARDGLRAIELIEAIRNSSS